MLNGIKTTGVIFKNELETINSENRFYTPVIRFISDNGEWITKKYESVSTYLSLYKEGDKVEVIYEEGNPDKFILEMDFKQRLIDYVLFVAGILLLSIGGYGLLQLIIV